MHPPRFVLAICGLLVAAPLKAQDPFSTLELQVHVATNVNRSVLHEYWGPGAGGAAAVATPFYRGFLEFGSALHRYNGLADVPGFGALWLYGGWGLQATTFSRLKLEGSLRLGNYRMSFDSAGVEFSGTATESELAFGTSVRATIRITGPVSVFAAIQGLNVRTSPRMPLWYVTGGLSATVTTPAGLRTFFQ